MPRLRKDERFELSNVGIQHVAVFGELKYL
jgi:hypothetical protein